MKNHSRYWLWFGAAAAAVVLLIATLHQRYPDALSNRDGQISLVHGLLILAFVGSSLLVRDRLNLSRMARDATLWTAIGGLVFIAYGFRHDIAWLGHRMMGELSPSSGMTTADAIRFPMTGGGHFLVEALVDGEPIRFVVDTGASDVVLTPDDARRLGFDVTAMAFTRTYQTANGTVQGAPVRLGSIEIGPIRVNDVRASVNSAPMTRSLLGMSFLSRLDRYEVSEDALTFYR